MSPLPNTSACGYPFLRFGVPSAQVMTPAVQVTQMHIKILLLVAESVWGAGIETPELALEIAARRSRRSPGRRCRHRHGREALFLLRTVGWAGGAWPLRVALLRTSGREDSRSSSAAAMSTDGFSCMSVKAAFGSGVPGVCDRLPSPHASDGKSGLAVTVGVGSLRHTGPRCGRGSGAAHGRRG